MSIQEIAAELAAMAAQLAAMEERVRELRQSKRVVLIWR